jgi:hypothetical protein
MTRRTPLWRRDRRRRLGGRLTWKGKLACAAAAGTACAVAATHGLALIPLAVALIAGGGWRLRRRRHLLRRAPVVLRRRQPFPPEVRAAIWARYGGRCAHCGITDTELVARTGKHLEYDHIIPFSLGGEETEENGQTLCGSGVERNGSIYAGCNQSKGNRYIG